LNKRHGRQITAITTAEHDLATFLAKLLIERYRAEHPEEFGDQRSSSPTVPLPSRSGKRKIPPHE